MTPPADETAPAPLAGLPAPLAEALARKGYTDLTAVQKAVVSSEAAGRDLRISSQTGSGKTVAFAIAVAPILEGPRPEAARGARPRVIVLAPTRELALQVQSELAWSLAGFGARVVAVIGGTSVRGELRALAGAPDVIVGTPGRLQDHLERGAIDPACVRVVVLDEADQMLDLGFREALETILGRMPVERRTHLVSATFSPEVLRLAQRFQRAPLAVEGTRLGAAHSDIEHLVMILPAHQRVDALVNLLLLDPSEHTLVFVRTRAGVAELHADLVESGFVAAMLSGEMEQAERLRTLRAFKSGRLSVLVATDVAARGIDVADVGRVVHFDAATDPEMYTHRSGRTGRAGRKGTSVTLLTPALARRFDGMLQRMRVPARQVPPPGAAEVRRMQDARLVAELSQAPEEAPSGRALALAARLLSSTDPALLVARLLARLESGPADPRDVQGLAPPRAEGTAKARPARSREVEAPARGPGPRAPRDPGFGGAPARGAPKPPRDEHDATRFVPFRVTWGANDGADARRLMAIACRRGNIRGGEVGSIRVGDHDSIVEVDARVAAGFAEAVRKPDHRDRGVRILPLSNPAPPPPTRGWRGPIAGSTEGRQFARGIRRR